MGNPRVLVIDDDLAVREAISAGLRLDGYDLIFAENGADALAALKRSTPRVVILDLKMPVMDGLEFLSNVQLDHSGAIAVVVLTAYVDDDSVEACFNAGITALVRKPFILNELRGAVQAAITHREQTRLLNEMLVEWVAAGLAQDKVPRGLDIMAKDLQELARLQRNPSNPTREPSNADPSDPLRFANPGGTE